LTAHGIAEAMQAMNCRAVGISALDLAGGTALLQEIEKKEKLHWLSANLVDPKDRKPIFSPFLTTTVGDTSITILGLTDAQAPVDNDTYVILPWKEVLAKNLHQAPSGSMVILLSSYPEPVNRQIAEQVPGIDIILQSGHTPANRPPHLVGDTLLLQTAAQGKYLGMMRINWTDAGQWGEDFTARIRAEQNRIGRINWQLNRIKKRTQGMNPEQNKRYQDLLTSRKKSEIKIAELKKAREKKTGEPCSFHNRFIALQSSLPEDPKVQAILDRTTRQINNLNRKKSQNSGMGRHVEKTFSTLAGSRSCKKCHPRQMNFWLQTGHARAWQTLADEDQQHNESCLPCHVTLPPSDQGQMADRDLLLIPDRLQEVGCETCHGPALAHGKAPDTDKPMRPDEKICRQCHTPERDDNFIFADKKEKIRCPQG
jgi:2',3'-cyclic-nucleotide 2'-phosphodiesterase (5'-nucleotidase family)